MKKFVKFMFIEYKMQDSVLNPAFFVRKNRQLTKIDEDK